MNDPRWMRCSTHGCENRTKLFQEENPGLHPEVGWYAGSVDVNGEPLDVFICPSCLEEGTE